MGNALKLSDEAVTQLLAGITAFVACHHGLGGWRSTLQSWPYSIRACVRSTHQVPEAYSLTKNRRELREALLLVKNSDNDYPLQLLSSTQNKNRGKQQ